MSHPTHSDHPPAFDTTSKVVAGAIGLLSVIAGLLMGINNPFLSRATSAQGSRIDALFSITLGIATVVFVIVQGFLLYSVIRFAREPGDESDGPPIRGNTRLEFFWTAIPAITIVIIGILSYRVLAEIERPAASEMVVEVTGIQYAWQFYYPEYDLTTNELHIPLDRQVLLKMRSKDVIHSFWVPEFRVKKDVMPDRVTEARITGTALGTYPIVCTELCGAGHAVMRSQVVVHSDADYKTWVASVTGGKAAAAEAQPADPVVALGRQLFRQYGCDACHALADAGALGVAGPKLDGLGARAAGTVPGQAAADYIRTSIVKPGDFLVAGYPDIMQKDYGQRIPEADLNALVDYLLLQQ